MAQKAHVYLFSAFALYHDAVGRVHSSALPSHTAFSLAFRGCLGSPPDILDRFVILPYPSSTQLTDHISIKQYGRPITNSVIRPITSDRTAAMPPKLVLTYFDVPGAAEPARWALALSGLEWEDRRLSREEFGVLKPSECLEIVMLHAPACTHGASARRLAQHGWILPSFAAADCFRVVAVPGVRCCCRCTRQGRFCDYSFLILGIF